MFNIRPAPSNPRGTPDAKWNHEHADAEVPQSGRLADVRPDDGVRPNAPLTIPWVSLGIPNYSYQVNIVQGSGSKSLWNNLDEDSEIGSCDIYAQYATQPNPKRPRALPGEGEPRRVRVHPHQLRRHAEPAASARKARRLVLRMLCCECAGKVVANITTPPYAYYPGQTSTCNCPPDQAICLPCGRLPAPNSAGRGSDRGEVGVAQLTPRDNPAHFYTRPRSTTTSTPAGRSPTTTTRSRLVGMHIIHKTTNFPDFVFATFEQVDVERLRLRTTSSSGRGDASGPVGRHRAPAPARPTGRRCTRCRGRSIRDDKVRAQLVAMNPASVWQYYRLTGVRGSLDTMRRRTPAGQHDGRTSTASTYQTRSQATTLNPELLHGQLHGGVGSRS